MKKTKQHTIYKSVKNNPHRVAARLEGVVKNVGIKTKKKKPKHEK